MRDVGAPSIPTRSSTTSSISTPSGATRRCAPGRAASVRPRRPAARAASGRGHAPGDLGAMMRRAALMSFARDDPLAALSHAEALPPGGEREQMLSTIATSYGRTDPEAALAWAQSLSPPSPNVVANVLAGLARVDPDRAIDLLFETLTPAPSSSAGPMHGARDERRVERGAHGRRSPIACCAQPNRGPALQMLTQMWAQREPRRRPALAARESAARRRGRAIGASRHELARTDPAAADRLRRPRPARAARRLGSAPSPRVTRRTTRARQRVGSRSTAASPATTPPSPRSPAEPPRSDPVGRGAAVRLDQRRRGARRAASARNDRRNAGRGKTRRAAASWARDDRRRRSPRGGRRRRRGAMGRARRRRRARLDARACRRRRARRGARATPRRDGGHAVDRRALLDAFSEPDSAAARRRRRRAHHRRARSGRGARSSPTEYLTDPGARQAAERFIEQGANGPVMGPPPPRLPPRR